MAKRKGKAAKVVTETVDPTRLAALFQGLTRAYGVYGLPAGRGQAKGKKVEGEALTVRGTVTPDLWLAHLRGEQGLGIVPVTDDGTGMFAAIDIDRYDIDITSVEQQCAMLGLPLLPTRTKSGGVHLYCFAREPISCALLRGKLEEWSVALGYGGAEVFPKQVKLASERDTGNWINMPYFNALAGATDRYGIFRGTALSLAQFCERAESIRVTATILEQLQLPTSEDFDAGPPCLQSLARSGFPEGQRNTGLMAVGIYLKKRWPDDWAARIMEYNAKYLRPPLQANEVAALTKSLTRKEYNYSCDKAPIKLFCNRKLCLTREFGVGGGGEWDLAIGDDVLKIKTDPPYWIITVNGQRMELFAQQLTNQRLFRELCLEKINKFPTGLTPDRWREEVNKIASHAQEIEAPEDAGAGGELLYWLRQFCTVYPQAETREEILVGKPFAADGRVHFRSADFKQFLESKHYRALSGPRLYARLREYGLDHKQFFVADRNIMVWHMAVFEQPMTQVPVREPPDNAM